MAPYIPAWQEVESKVYRPGTWLAFLVGAVFTLLGAVGFLTAGGSIPAGTQLWIAKLLLGTFALFGGIILVWAIKVISVPIQVRHAAPDVLPNVPKEPVICEGSVVHGRLTHELRETAQGWECWPARNGWRNDKRSLLAFGIPFLTFFSGLLAWVLHSQLNIANWPPAVVFGTLATAVCGGSVFLLMGMMIRSGYRRLATLTIPRNGNDLELESAEAPKLEKADLAEGPKWLFIGETARQRLTIPREMVVAVQLCPWKFATTTERSWAVQGLLVLASRDAAVYHRLPVLLTNDFVGAARLMQELSRTLHIPFLFCADAEGWKAEELRAKDRPPLRIGGSQS